MRNFLSLSEIQSELAAGTITVEKLTSHYLKNIEENNGRLNAFLSVFREESLQQAQNVDQKVSKGTQGKLAGLIVGIKDVFCYRNHPLNCGSKILEGFESQFTATCIQRLMDEDAIIIGRQNCDEFAMGSTNENSAFGPVKNPIDHTKVPGGSSGGSACAVAADFCQVSIGSDTGGSVRQPAAYCGVIGLKPTYGRISRYGLAAYASSFDTVGIVGKCSDDIAKVLKVMAGPDEFDSTVSTLPVPEYLNSGGSSYKIAVMKDSFNDVVQDDLKQSIKDLLMQLKSMGHEVEEIAFPLQEYLLPTYYILTAAEASSNLSRYDGVRFGMRSEANDINEMYKRTRTNGFGIEVKRRIMMGTFVLSASYHDAYYLQAQKVRKMIKEASEKILNSFDFILSPTAPSSALGLGEVSNDPIKMYMEDLFTVQANVVGVPAISVPIGKDAEGLPFAVQLMSQSFSEDKLLDISNQIITLNR